MKSFLPILFFFLFTMKLSAQNLVPNGSFEELTSCPPSWSGIDSCIGWFTESNSPDCLASCAPYPVSIPYNALGYQLAFEGLNYAGFYSFYSFGANIDETMGSVLNDSLIIGNVYHFSMRVCRAFNSPSVVAATNHIGAKFSQLYYTADNFFSSDNFQQLDEDTLITDTANWILLQWEFVADSAYKYIYLGNFFNDASTDTLKANNPNSGAYYYIDSVNLFCVSGNCALGVSNEINPSLFIQFDESSGNLNLQNANAEAAEFFLINVLGEKIIDQAIADNTMVRLTHLPKGMYIAYIITEQKKVVKKVLIR